MSTAAAPALDPATRAKLATEAARHTARIAALDKLIPTLVEKHAYFRGRLAEADARRAVSALNLVEQHLAGSNLDEARLAHNVQCLKSLDSENAKIFADLIAQAVAAARSEHADRTTKLAAIEARLAKGAA
jgi:hypothetical protein